MQLTSVHEIDLSRASQSELKGRMWPVGRVMPRSASEIRSTWNINIFKSLLRIHIFRIGFDF